MTTLVLLHSPLVGPLTWQPVAARLDTPASDPRPVPGSAASDPRPVPGSSRLRCVAPDLRAVPDGDPGRIADLLRAIPGPKVLAGHSGAGRRLPAIAAALGDVGRVIYVDAEPPEPGRTWWDSAPADLVAHLRGIAQDGHVPPWNEWFTPEDVAAVLPDPELRAAFVAELRPVPLAFFDLPAPAVTWAGPTGFLLLSDGYRAAAEDARAAGATVVEEPGHHLLMLTDPDRVANALRTLLR